MFFSHNPFRHNKYFPQDPYFPPLPNLTDGLVAYWPLEDNVFDDVSGNGYHLTHYGLEPEFIDTPIGNAFLILDTDTGDTADGSYAYVNNLPTTIGSYDNSQAFTFVFWIVPYVYNYESEELELSPINWLSVLSPKIYPLGHIGNQPQNYFDPFPNSIYNSNQYNSIVSFSFINRAGYYHHHNGRLNYGPIFSFRTYNLSYRTSGCDYSQRITSYEAPYAMVSISYFDQLNNSTPDFSEYYDGPMTGVETYTYFYPPFYYMSKQISPFHNLSFFTDNGRLSSDSYSYYTIPNWTRFLLGLCYPRSFYYSNLAVKHVGLWYRRLARHELDYLYYCQAQRLPF